MEEIRVERLGRSSESEMRHVLAQAFAERPLIPAVGAPIRDAHGVLTAFLDLFGATKRAQRHGIRDGNRLVCASLSVDAAEEPSPFALLRFIVALSRCVGWRAAREFEVVHKEMPKYSGRYLELVLLGTLPEYQGRGLGRRMVRFLTTAAKEGGFSGVILVADRDAPVFRFYLKEGFVVDRMFTVGETALCWMRHECTR